MGRSVRWFPDDIAREVVVRPKGTIPSVLWNDASPDGTKGWDARQEPISDPEVAMQKHGKCK